MKLMSHKNKKILIIGSSLNYGSPGKICENLGLLAMQDGWKVFQAHGLKYSRPSQLITRPVSSNFEEKIHTIYSFLFDGHGLASTKSTHRIVEWIQNIKPDVIHLHNLHGYFLNYKILFDYLSTLDTPIIWTLHDFWPITGHCAHFDNIGCTKWKTQCFACPQRSAYPRSLCIDASTRNYNIKKRAFTSIKNMIIISVSDWVGNIVKESFLGKYFIRTIYNGVDMEVFKPTDSNLRQELGLSGKFVLLGISSPWYEMKGLYDYFKLSKLLPEEYRIIMIGLTPSQIRKLPNNIIGIERTENQVQLAKFYSMADVVLNLSYQETFGMTTVEGLACGTPCIVYNRTASPELVTSETGNVVEAGNIEALLKAIFNMRERGKKYFSKACIQRVSDKFNKKTQFQEYIKLYNQLLDR